MTTPAVTRRPGPVKAKAHVEQLVVPDLIPWGRGAVIGFSACTVVIILGAGIMARPGLVVVGIVGAVLCLLGCGLAWRANTRRSIAAELTNQTMTGMNTPLKLVRARWPAQGWPGTIAGLVISYPPTFAALHGDQAARMIAMAASKAAGSDLAATVRKHQPRRCTVVLGFKPAEADTTDQATQRIHSIVEDTLGATGAATGIELADTGDVARFTIDVVKASRFTDAAMQRRFTRAITGRLDGQWNAEFDLEHDRIHFTRRVPLPTIVLRPVESVTADDARIAEAVDEDGNTHYWEVGGVMAHQLRAGRTRTGKTVAMYGDLVECARRNWQIFVLDPKRIEFLGWRTWPNVSMVATTIEDQLVMVNYLHDLMDERYRQIEEDGADPADFHRILIIIDEFRQFFGMAKAWWSQIKVQGMPSEPPALEQIGSILRMAAAARIHVLLGTQRPDADVVKGEQRDNFSARSATGRLSPDGAQMMFDSQHIGVSTPRIQGRGTIVGLDEHPREVQFFFTPDPRTPNTEEQDLLTQLRPAATVWPPMQVSWPNDDAVDDAVASSPRKTSPFWERIQLATLTRTAAISPFPTPATAPKASQATNPEPAEQVLPSRLARTTFGANTTVPNSFTRPHTSTTAVAAPAASADPAPAPAEGEGDTDSDDELYGPIDHRKPLELHVGDLIDLDGVWVCVHEDPVDDDDSIEVTWRDDTDTIETIALDPDCVIRTRRAALT